MCLINVVLGLLDISELVCLWMIPTAFNKRRIFSLLNVIFCVIKPSELSEHYYSNLD